LGLLIWWTSLFLLEAMVKKLGLKPSTSHLWYKNPCMQVQEHSLDLYKGSSKAQPREIEEGFKWLNLLSSKGWNLRARIDPCMWDWVKNWWSLDDDDDLAVRWRGRRGWEHQWFSDFSLLQDESWVLSFLLFEGVRVGGRTREKFCFNAEKVSEWIKMLGQEWVFM
jgi:hypothetical protein